ncbi:hypothetical protein B0H13DRAFT_1851180 [Mycena leptocephala]|nr:hypothetical protein B0H13DRAFT_1851180 [Mycena leptocephala]
MPVTAALGPSGRLVNNYVDAHKYKYIDAYAHGVLHKPAHAHGVVHNPAHGHGFPAVFASPSASASKPASTSAYHPPEHPMQFSLAAQSVVPIHPPPVPIVGHTTKNKGKSVCASVPAGPSTLNQSSGPVSPFPSGLDVLFTLNDPLQNIIAGDLYSVYSHLSHHGIPVQGLSVGQARHAIIYHLLSGMCATTLPDGSLAFPHVGCKSSAAAFSSPQHMSHAAYSIILSASLPATHLNVAAAALGVSHSDVMQVLSIKRTDLFHGHGIANPLHATFDRVELLPKGALISLAALHGVDISSHALPVGRNVLATHIVSGRCGLHKSGFRHLGCASLLSLSHLYNDNLHVSQLDLEDAMTVSFDLAQINILASVMKKLNKHPLRRILQMHHIKFETSDGTAALRKLLKGYLRRPRRGKKLVGLADSRLADKTILVEERDRELAKLSCSGTSLDVDTACLTLFGDFPDFVGRTGSRGHK